MRNYDDDEQDDRHYFIHNCIGCNRRIEVIIENNRAYANSDEDKCICGESFRFLDDIEAELKGT